AHLDGSTALAADLNVNDPGKFGDFNPGDGRCDSDANIDGEQCTIRAATDEANGQGGGTITVPGGGYDAWDGSLGGGLSITTAITINGASEDSTILNGDLDVTGGGTLTISRVT